MGEQKIQHWARLIVGRRAKPYAAKKLAAWVMSGRLPEPPAKSAADQ